MTLGNDDRGKFMRKKNLADHFSFNPIFQASSGKLNSIYTKSTWKKATFGTGPIVVLNGAIKKKLSENSPF